MAYVPPPKAIRADDWSSPVSAPCAPPTREPDVVSALSILNNACAGLDERITALANRLTPLLSATEPRPSSVRANGLCELSERIRSFAASIADADERIIAILKDLEI